MPLPRPGQTVLASSLASAPGGKGGNQAVAAARAGADGAARRRARHRLRPPSSCAPTCAPTTSDSTAWSRLPGPSGSAAIIVDAAAENTIVVAPGANAHLSVDSADVRAVIADSDVVLHAVGDPDRHRAAAAASGRASGRTRSSSSTRRRQAPKPHDLLALSELADVVVVNEAEAREWHWPVPHLVITRGVARRQLPGRGRAVRRACARGRARSTPPARATSSRACWPRAGRPATRTRCDGHARRARCRRWCRAPGDCAPYAEAIEDAVINSQSWRKATMTTTDNAAAARRRLAGHAVPALHAAKGRSACARWTGPRRATR